MQKLKKSKKVSLRWMGSCCPWERAAWGETSLPSELCQHAACCAPLKSWHLTPPSWSIQAKILSYVLWPLTPSSISAAITTRHRIWLLHICPQNRLPISPVLPIRIGLNCLSLQFSQKGAVYPSISTVLYCIGFGWEKLTAKSSVLCEFEADIHLIHSFFISQVSFFFTLQLSLSSYFMQLIL